MKNITNILVVALIALVGGLYFKSATVVNSPTTQVVTSAVGTTFTFAKVAQINFSPATGSATSTSLLNTDSFDRYITDSFVACTGIGSSFAAYTGAGIGNLGLQFNLATTSTSAPNTVTNYNKALFTGFGTTTDYFNYVASSTQFQASTTRVWASGSYMTAWSNATNTAACTIGLHYVGS